MKQELKNKIKNNVEEVITLSNSNKKEIKIPVLKPKLNKEKLKIGVFGISGCAGCLLTILYEDCFKELVEIFDIKAFPLIKADSYKGDFDYVFIEGTVCFDEDIEMVNELRRRAKKIVALGSCSCSGGVPAIKNFMNSEKALKLVYPKHNNLRAEPPTPVDKHVTVDYYLPQCPPNKDEIIEFARCITSGREFKPYRNPVCLECRSKGNPCLLEQGKICLGPISNGGCGALCPSNNTVCYGCRGPFKDANIPAFIDMLKDMGYDEPSLHEKMMVFAGLQFKEAEGEKSTWMEK